MTTRKYRKANNFRKTRLKKGGEKKKSKQDGKYNKKSSPVKKEVSPVKEEEVCAICLEKIEETDNIPKLPCDHEFHKHCLMPLCKIKNNIKVECPLCRASITKSCKSDINPLPRRSRLIISDSPRSMEERRQRLMNMTMEERQQHVQRDRRNYLARRRYAIARETPQQRDQRESRESREAREEIEARNRYFQGNSRAHIDQNSRNM